MGAFAPNTIGDIRETLDTMYRRQMMGHPEEQPKNHRVYDSWIDQMLLKNPQGTKHFDSRNREKKKDPNK